jgi:hypothetical protein
VNLVRGTLAVAVADFLERVRRHRTLVTTAVLVLAAHFFLPPIGARYITLQLDDFRGAYGSAYVGTLCAILCGAFLSLAGFYLVKDAVDRDRTSRVGEILASTPLSRFAYVLGKWISNVTLLAGMLVVVAVAAGVLQLVRAEDTRLDPVALAIPFAVIALPVMAVTAAIAVLFEATPGLRGGSGNVVYFFLWTGLLSGTASLVEGPEPAPGADFVGFSVALPSLYEAQARAYPQSPARRDHFSAGVNFKSDATWKPRTFAWHGVPLDAAILGRRLLWASSSFALLAVSALLFDRFRGSGETSRRRRARDRLPAGRDTGAGAAETPAAPAPTATHLTPLSERALRPTFAPLVAQEFALLLKGTSRWWWIPVLGLTLAALLAPLPAVLEWILLALWIWPLLHWSSLGGREQRHATLELVLSAPRPVLRPVLAAWLAGVALALLVAAGVLVRLVLTGSWGHLGGLLAGACFVPAFALALGTWTGSGKMFEILYLLLWYLATNRVPALDYTGGTRDALERGLPLVWAALAAVMIGAAIAGRSRRAARG